MRRAPLVVLLFVAACSPKPNGSSSAGVADSSEPPAPPPAAPAPPAPPPPESIAVVASVDAVHEGGRIALAVVDGATTAFVADEDLSVIHVVDVATKKLLVSSPLDGVPSQLVVSGGRVLVALRDRARIVAYVVTL